ncbi:MAG TPA: branched-chain amino acid ABC transporter permease [Firmicutes bacterium]|jgi:branched-chain amino acid transport system permease protein|nr:branched-chain amino acid ABC transporter permease [Bacillota bacterium]
MSQLLQQLVNGLSLGSIYALIALGYTMVYGIIRLINFAHGDIYMVGAFVGYFALRGGLPLPFAFFLAMIIPALFGLVIEFFAYRPLRNAPRIAALITAIGVSLFLENLGILVLSPDPRPFPQVLPDKSIISYGDVNVSLTQFLMIVITLALMVLLTLFVHYTKTGKAMRAVSQDREAAQLMGININRIISVTFVIGSALAGAAGVLVGLYIPRIEPLMGVMYGLKAFVAAVIGGIGIIPGAMLGGVLMGLAETLVTGFLASTWRDAIAFGLLILILLIKPSGIFGTSSRTKV